MITITQKKCGTRNLYYKTETDSAGIAVSHEPYDCRLVISTEGGRKLIIPLDKDGNIRRDLFRYLNETCRYEKFSSLRQTATALNLFHIFCDITGYDPADLSPSNVQELMRFFLGQSVRNHDDTPMTYRTPTTVNGYYAAVKKYVITNQWNTSAFVQFVPASRMTVIGDITMQSRYPRDPNRLKVDSFKKYITPKHLNPEQASALLKELKAAGDKTTLLIARLQIGYGLRCGECLGITLEDVKRIRHGEGYRYCIILRNRCSDAPDQHCKTLYHPTSENEYSEGTYHNTEKWVVDIKESMYDMLVSYYEKTRGARMSAERRRRMEEETAADQVERKGGRVPSRKNYYLFVGTNGRRFTAQTYNNHLKHCYEKIGIPLDKGKKHANCSHKLRHTFAMMLTTYSDRKVSRGELRLQLRHRCIASGEKYYTPTEEQIFNIKSENVRAIYELLPGLED